MWGRKWSIFLPHKNSTPRYHPMVFTLFVTVFVGQEMVNFPAPQKLDPKISPHGIHAICDSVCGAGNGQFSCPTKTRPQAPKSGQNRGIFDVYAEHKTTSVAKTPLFATFLQHNMSEMLYFTVFLDHLLTVNFNEFKDYTFHGNKPQKAKTLIFTAFLRNGFSKKMFFLDHFWLLKAPKTKRGEYPPTPLPHLEF